MTDAQQGLNERAVTQRMPLAATVLSLQTDELLSSTAVTCSKNFIRQEFYTLKTQQSCEREEWGAND